MIVSPVTLWKKFDLTQGINAETEAETLTPAGFSAVNVRLDGHLTKSGARVKIFARYTKPRGGESAPALLLLPDPGDDGRELADYFAAKGYATLIPDYCGKRGLKKFAADETEEAEAYGAEENEARQTENAAESDAEEATREAADEAADEARGEEKEINLQAGGKPEYTVYPEEIAYANFEISGAPARLEGESVEESAWFEWAYVALYSLEYLKTRGDVTKIGIAGVRLGGEIAWMTSLSPDICCLAAINAAGWRSHLFSSRGGKAQEAAGEEADAVRAFVAGVEAESYAPFVKCPVLMCCAMEDNFFDCDRAYDTFVRLGNADGSAIVYSADSGKCIGPYALADVDLFLERHLKGRHIYIPKPIELTMTELDDGRIEIAVKTDGDALVNTLSLYYAEGAGGQISSCRAWQRVKKIAGGELKDNRVSCAVEAFSGAEYAFSYASAEFVNGFKTVSPIVGRKRQKKSGDCVKERVISAGEKDGFAVADYKTEALGGIFLEKESMPETVAGYGGIKGVYSPAGIRTYRISSPRFVADDGAALKMDLYSAKDTSVKITVETGERGAGSEYSAIVPVAGGGKWKRAVLRAEELKDERTGKSLESFSKGIALVIRPESEDCPVPVANVLWL